ncbi:Tn3 family transposase TnXax1 [Methylobacterium crusticola]|uniref:Tn3 family transposase TnXax1 n=1 Tax=Methylobacterium crusticola TaxID=1697972 RepID=A0ABQ4QYS8_9HYPH|nr:lytic murein transglycosylase [Methylobacterium crusticola]GJD49806.1 Tn3 family transposase TnXax1 [Methylobacterium crusticola]
MRRGRRHPFRPAALLLGFLASAGAVPAALGQSPATGGEAPATGAGAPAEAAPAAPGAASPEVTPSLDRCLADVAPLTAARGVPAAVVARELDGLSPDLDALAASRHQAEFETPIWEYVDRATKDSRVAAGRAKLAEWAPTLSAIEAAYGVDRHVLVAIWSIESGYGAVLDDPTKVRPVVQALATLACLDERRGPYWRDELVAALQIVAEGGVPAERITGSWAGAMGHTQFMPTTYLRQAVDFDRDGKRDIWHSVPDALASTASYLRALGWPPGEAWGYEAALPEGFDYALADEVTTRPLSEWQARGLRPAGPAPVASPDARARLVLPAGARGPALLLLPGFDAILRYNTSLAYALAVAHLSDRLRGGPDFAHAWPRDDRPLSAEERRDLQAALAARGYDVGGVDGKVGPRTRAAIRAYQASAGRVQDGYADASLLAEIRAGR